MRTPSVSQTDKPAHARDTTVSTPVTQLSARPWHNCQHTCCTRHTNTPLTKECCLTTWTRLLLVLIWYTLSLTSKQTLSPRNTSKITWRECRSKDGIQFGSDQEPCKCCNVRTAQRKLVKQAEKVREKLTRERRKKSALWLERLCVHFPLQLKLRGCSVSRCFSNKKKDYARMREWYSSPSACLTVWTL